MKKMMGCRLIVLLLCAALFIGMVPAMAEEKGSLTIRLPKEIYGQLPEDADVEFTLTQIGTVDDSKNLVMAQGLADYRARILGATDTERGDIARELAGKIQSMGSVVGKTMKLVDGKATFSNLDKGLYLYVMTKAPDMLKGNPFIVAIPGENGALSYEIEAKAEIRGSLIVEKRVLSDVASDSSRAFSFTVTLGDVSINGQHGEMFFTNGVATFTLRHGERKKATDLPMDLEYAVEEKSEEGFTVSWSGNTGKTTAAGALAVCTNTREKGDLTVKKTVESELPADKTRDYRFTVILSDKSISGLYGDMRFVNGVATFTLRDNETKTAAGLPALLTYRVVETTEDGFETAWTGDTGTITTTPSSAVFTNTRRPGELIVMKTVYSDSLRDLREVAFTFKVTLSDKTINGEYGQMTFTNGEATFTLKHGESKRAVGLPEGTGYTVTETAADGYRTTFTGETGEIKASGSTAAFVNERETGGLTVTKTVSTPTALEKEDYAREFTFTVTLDDTTISGTFGGMTFTNGVATFTLKHGEKMIATDLPRGVGYTVTEADEQGFTATWQGQTGTILSTGSDVVCLNERKTAFVRVDDRLELSKVDWAGRALEGAEFTLFYQDGKTPKQVMTFSTQSFSVSTDDPVLADYLPEGDGGELVLVLVETKAPKGFLPLDDPLEIHVTKTTTHALIEGVYTTTTTYRVSLVNGEKKKAILNYTPTPTPTATPTPTPTATPTPTPTTPPEGTAPTPTPVTEITVQKNWEDDTNANNVRPSEIIVELYADGVFMEQYTLTAAEGWTHSFTNLPEYKMNGHRINYSVNEVKVEHYDTFIDGTVITNRLIEREPEAYTEIKGTKIWEDGDNEAKRPGSITIQLLRDGVVYRTLVVTSATDWRYTFSNLPVDDGYGHDYKYTLREVGVAGYYATVTEDYNIINKPLGGGDGEYRQTGGGDGEVVTTHGRQAETRDTGTPEVDTSNMTDEEFEEAIDFLDYNVPLWGQLMGTGDETPVWPWVFAGIGAVALILIPIIGMRRKRRGNR